MLIRSIKFPKTKNKYFRKIDNKKICFYKESTNKIANIVVFIGRNGSGKSTLIRWLYQYHEWWNEKYCLAGCPEIEYSDNYENNYLDETCMFVEAYRNKINFCCRLLPHDEHGYVGDGNYDDAKRKFFLNYVYPYNSRTFSKQCGIKTIYMSTKYPRLKLEEFYKKIEEWDTLKEPKRKEYIVPFFDDVNILEELNNVKHKLENLYFADHKKKVDEINDINSIMSEKQKINLSSLQTDFIKLTHEINEKINLNIISDEKNKSFVVRMKSDDKSIVYDFGGLSSGYKKMLLIYFTIIEIRLFDRDKRLILFIDEIENSLYPNQQEEFITFLIELSEQLSKENIEHQFFIATHSPFISKGILNKGKDRSVILDIGVNNDIIKDINTSVFLTNAKINSVTYDEILYFYYDITTPNYYLMLFERMKNKICEFELKKLQKNKIDDKKKLERLKKGDIYYCEVDNYLKQNNGNLTLIRKYIGNPNENMNENEYQTIILRIRHLIVHGYEEEKWFVYYKQNESKFVNEEITNNFYKDFFNNDLKRHLILKENIEKIQNFLKVLMR